MSKFVSGPRLQVRLYNPETDTREPLIDSAVDDVIDFIHRVKDHKLFITLLDPEQKIASRIAEYSKNVIAARIFRKKAIVEAFLESDENFQKQFDLGVRPVEFRHYTNEDQANLTWHSGAIYGFQTVQDSTGSHLIKVSIAALPTATAESLQSDDESASVKVRSKNSVGTFTRSSGGFINTLDADKVIEGIEQIYASVVSNPFEGAECMVVLNKSMVDRIRQEASKNRRVSGRSRNQNRIGFWSTKFNLGFIRQNGELLLESSMTIDTTEQRARRIRDTDRFGAHVAGIVDHLNNVSKELGGSARYTAQTYNEIDFLEAFGFGPNIRTLTVIMTESDKALFEQRKFDRKDSVGAERLTTASKALIMFDARIKEIESGRALSLWKANKLLLFRSGVSDPNVLSITTSNEVGKIDLVALNSSFNLLSRRAATDVIPLLRADLLVTKAAAQQQWDNVWKEYFREQITELPMFKDLVQTLNEESGLQISASKDNELYEFINSLVEKQEKSIGNDFDGRSPEALANILAFIRERQREGGDTVVVKTFYSPEMSNQLANGTSIAVLEYVHPTAASNLLSRGTSKLTNVSPLTGLYFVYDVVHSVTNSDAFTEVTMIRFPHDVAINEDVKPLQQDEPDIFEGNPNADWHRAQLEEARKPRDLNELTGGRYGGSD